MLWVEPELELIESKRESKRETFRCEQSASGWNFFDLVIILIYEAKFQMKFPFSSTITTHTHTKSRPPNFMQRNYQTTNFCHSFTSLLIRMCLPWRFPSFFFLIIFSSRLLCLSLLIILPFPQLKSHPRKMMKINLINFYCLHSTRLASIFRLLPLLRLKVISPCTQSSTTVIWCSILFFEWSARVRLGVGVHHVPDVIQKKKCCVRFAVVKRAKAEPQHDGDQMKGVFRFVDTSQVESVSRVIYFFRWLTTIFAVCDEDDVEDEGAKWKTEKEE